MERPHTQHVTAQPLSQHTHTGGKKASRFGPSHLFFYLLALLQARACTNKTAAAGLSALPLAQEALRCCFWSACCFTSAGHCLPCAPLPCPTLLQILCAAALLAIVATQLQERRWQVDNTGDLGVTSVCEHGLGSVAGRSDQAAQPPSPSQALSKPDGFFGWQAFTDSQLCCPRAAAGYATTSSVDLCEYGYWAGAVSVVVSVILLMLQVSAAPTWGLKCSPCTLAGWPACLPAVPGG